MVLACSGALLAADHGPLRHVPILAWQLQQEFPQDCPHSGTAVVVAAFPSGLFPLWQGSSWGSPSVKTVPALAWWHLGQLFLQDFPNSGKVEVHFVNRVSGSCGSPSLRTVPTLAWWHLWQSLPQDCPHSAKEVVVAALPSGLSPLWQGGRCGNLPLKTVPTLAR